MTVWMEYRQDLPTGSERDNAADAVRGRNTIQGIRQWGLRKVARLCGERRSKGAGAVFAAGGNGDKRTLLRRGAGCPFQRAALLGEQSADCGGEAPSPSESPLTSFQPGGLKVS